ncbi:hypothetical protein Tco_1197772 [Tanacetum coccineum]
MDNSGSKIKSSADVQPEKDKPKKASSADVQPEKDKPKKEKPEKASSVAAAEDVQAASVVDGILKWDGCHKTFSTSS